MARKKKTNSKAPTAAPDDIIYDRMPGADPIDDAKFEVDMNFATPEEEVTFPEGETVEETEETETVASGDEVASQESTEEPEAKAEVEAEESADSSGEAAADEVVEEAASADDGGVEEEALEPEPVKKKSPMVPKSRLDEVLAKNKAMQKKITAIEQAEADAEAEAPKYDFNSKESEYQQLLLDGDLETASGLRTEIRNAERERILFDVKSQMGQTVQQDRDAQELMAKAQEIEATFSILDKNSSDFNETLTKEVMDLRDAFIIQGFVPADSLAKATEYTLAVKYPELLKGAPEPSNVTQITEKKQKTTVRKKIAASKAQPPDMRGEGAGERGDKRVDLNVLSDSEFAALPEETIKRLRGDFG